jgi:hypothetical protein
MSQVSVDFFGGTMNSHQSKRMLHLVATRFIFTVGFATLVLPAFSQPAGGNPELQQKVAAVKQSVAANQQALRQYTWTETMLTIFKGDTKSTKVSQCRYGQDGAVHKAAIGPPQPPPSTPRGLKGKIVEKKTGEMEDYMERVASLIKRYTPPDGAAMQSSLQSGNASIVPSDGGIVTLAFHNYAKPGDTVTLTYDTATKKVRGYDVNTYLDEPADVVTLKVVFDNMPDGTNYVAQSVLDATAKQVQIRTTSSGYTKL